MGSNLDRYDDLEGRDTRGGGSAELSLKPGREGRALDVAIEEVSAGRSLLVTGPAIRHAYDGVSDGAPFRIWTRASTTQNLGSVRLIFRFQGLESNYAAYDVTPSPGGTWDETLISKGEPSRANGIVDWARVRRIDIEIASGASGPYRGEVRVDELRIGTTLVAGRTYEWSVRVDAGAGMSEPQLRPLPCPSRTAWRTCRSAHRTAARTAVRERSPQQSAGPTVAKHLRTHHRDR